VADAESQRPPNAAAAALDEEDFDLVYSDEEPQIFEKLSAKKQIHPTMKKMPLRLKDLPLLTDLVAFLKVNRYDVGAGDILSPPAFMVPQRVMRPLDVAHKAAWVAKQAGQLCMKTGKLLLSSAAQAVMAAEELAYRQRAEDPDRYLLGTVELADFIRNVILDNGFTLARGYEFPDSNDYFTEGGIEAVDAAYVRLLQYLPATYLKDKNAGIWDHRAAGTSSAVRDLRTFYECASVHERHPDNIKKWVKNVLEFRPASVLETSPPVAEGYAVVVDDVTGSVAHGLLRSGFRKVLMAFSPECVEALPVAVPTDLELSALAAERKGRNLKLQYNWENIVHGRGRTLVRVADSFIASNYKLTKGPYGHIWSDSYLPMLPPAPTPKELPPPPDGTRVWCGPGVLIIAHF
jgi:hypothetical protein